MLGSYVAGNRPNSGAKAGVSCDSFGGTIEIVPFPIPGYRFSMAT